MGLRLILIRHGAIDLRASPNFIGCQNLALSRFGLDQIEQIGLELVKEISGQVVAIVCSDLERSISSAKILKRILNFKKPLEIDPRIREISLGFWEKVPKDYIKAKWKGAYQMRGLKLESFVPQGGESFRMLARRVSLCLKELARRYADLEGYLILVTHAGVMRVVLANYLALPLKDILRIPLGYASYCEFSEGSWEIFN